MNLNGRKVAILATDKFEDSELADPMQAVKDAGAEITVVSDKIDNITGEHGTEVIVDKTIDDVTAEDFHALLIPGGVKNPDVLRTNEKAVAFVRAFFDQHKPVAAICHGPWLLVEAGVLKGRTVTSWPSLRTDITNAGGIWVDEEVVVEEGLVTSRNPNDIPAFTAKAIEEFGEGKHKEQTA